MRKLLLIAAALFSLGSMAQRPFESHTTFNSLNKSMKVNSLMSRMPAARIAKPANAQAKDPAKAPEGESHTYYLDCFNSCFKIGDIPEIHKAIDIVFAADNKVYIKNMMYPSMFDTYIEGVLKDNVITIKNGQQIGEVQGHNMVLCNMTYDKATNKINTDTSNDFTLTIDKDYGVITSEPSSYLGICTDDYQITLTEAGNMQFIPAELFPEADEYEYTYDYETASIPQQKGKKGTVQIIKFGQYRYIKGLMPEAAPDAWVMAEDNNGTLTVSLPQAIGEDYAAVFIDFSQGGTFIFDPVTFKYDAASDSYVMSEYSLIDLFPTYDEKTNTYSVGYSTSYNNLKIKATTTGISNVGNSDADVVSTEYYDLSGRRVSDAQKGLYIKVMKYADGTTKSVKTVK